MDGSAGRHTPMEEMELFRRFVSVANWAWGSVWKWSRLAQDTVGKQLIRACDTVGANLVEGDGRSGTADSIHFFVIARASAREARYWIQLAKDRDLVSADEAQVRVSELTSATQLLNNLVRYRRSRLDSSRVREETAEYMADEDPFEADI